MQETEFQFAGAQGTELPARLWLPDGQPRLVLQISHGMTEHSGRYDTLAAALAEHGIACAALTYAGTAAIRAAGPAPTWGRTAGSSRFLICSAFVRDCGRAFPVCRWECWAFPSAPSCCGTRSAGAWPLRRG